MTKQERFLQLFLRVIGTGALFAISGVLMSYSWMNAIHQWLGMGQLPDEPVVGYLARSTSAFYMLLGGFFWVVSFDLRRHRAVLCYLGAAVTVFGLVLFAVDLIEGMPLFWSLCEGPMNTLFGLLILLCSLRIGGQTGQANSG